MRIKNYSYQHETDMLTYFYHILLTRWGVLSLTLEVISSHRTHRFNRTFLRTVSNSQSAFGIQSSQSVTAKEGCWVMNVRC